MTLDDPIWKDLEGGYRIEYDASVPLKRLENSVTIEQTQEIFEELWDELHHQGDVGLASYLAVPQLVRIAKKKELFEWNDVGIKEYYRYFAIYHKDDPQVHLRVSYNEYETETLWSILKTILKEKESISMNSN